MRIFRYTLSTDSCVAISHVAIFPKGSNIPMGLNLFFDSLRSVEHHKAVSANLVNKSRHSIQGSTERIVGNGFERTLGIFDGVASPNRGANLDDFFF